MIEPPEPTSPDVRAATSSLTPRPDFIRALLEHVGAEINPIRLIRRIRDGLEIPGLKPALVKILQASNLQVSADADERGSGIGQMTDVARCRCSRGARRSLMEIAHCWRLLCKRRKREAQKLHVRTEMFPFCIHISLIGSSSCHLPLP